VEPSESSPERFWNRNLTPIPDPTILTSTAVSAAKDDLRRDMEAIQALLDARISAAVQLLETRLHALDRADTLLTAQIKAMPDECRLAIDHLRELMREQFATIEAHRRRLEDELTHAVAAHQTIREENKQLITAAIETQHDAIGVQTQHMTQTVNRIELMATRQLEQITTLLQTAVSGLQSKLDDLKERLTLLEGRTAGITAATTNQRELTKEQREGGQFMLAIVGFCAGTLLGIIGIILALMKG
jgi:hypothetical protein